MTSLTESTNLTNLDWSKFREEMVVSKKWAYFDHACVAPIPQSAVDAIAKWAGQASAEGDVVWPDWEVQHENLRSLAAQVLNGTPEEIALVPNTTFGINLVADGFPWEEGDNVVMPDHEFPSNVYPWMHLESRGVELRRVKLNDRQVDLNRIAEACDNRTRIVSASWVGYASGYRIDPAEIAKVAHDAGAYFFLDAIQGFGVHELDVKKSGVDFLAADGHKWLLGPEGAGIFYTKREHLEFLRPMNVGWNSVIQGNDFNTVDLDIRDTARRYEGGTQNNVGFIGLNASLTLLAKFGLKPGHSAIGDRVLSYSDEVCSAVEGIGGVVYSERGERCKSGIVSFDLPGKDSEGLKTHLLDNGVVVSQRGGRLRISAHCYNDANDLDRLIENLRSF